jgi:acyl carrier protein
MTRDEIFSVVKSNMREIIDDMDGKEIHETNRMSDFGADSLEIVEVVSRSMKQLKIRVRRTELVDAQNLRELVDLFEKAVADKAAED